ncbi:hypothetical protein, partial [Leptospira wolffii]|uniref:hypothetical protein n=1 Tax=Leptospira wolffii TaxID=409998 RepID=UPI0018DC7245
FFVSGDRAYAIGGTFGRKIAEAGSFVRKFATNPTFRNGVLEGMLDFTAGSIDALLNGKPMPYVTYHHGGYMIGNSYITDHRLLGYGKKHIPYESNGIAHVGHGTSLAVRKHESGHIDQDLNMGLASQHGYAKEISNDLTHGTINYNSSVYWFYKLIGPDATRNLAAANAWAYGGEVNYDSAVHSFNMGLYFNNVSNFDPISNWSTFMEAIKRDIWSGFQ